MKKKFKDACGYELNLQNPRGFNEKIQWIKVHQHDLLMTKCADKYEVRNYIKQKVDVHCPCKLTTIFGVWEKPENVPFDTLPSQFVLKSNHASGQGIIVKDKKIFNNDIGCLTVMIDRTQIPDIHMPSERHEDFITWLNILKQGWKAFSLPVVLAEYRKGNGSLTSNKWKSLLWTWRVYRDSQHLSLIQSGFCMAFYICNGLLKHYMDKGIRI